LGYNWYPNKRRKRRIGVQKHIQTQSRKACEDIGRVWICAVISQETLKVADSYQKMYEVRNLGVWPYQCHD
jgi:hypothetical protein